MHFEKRVAVVILQNGAFPIKLVVLVFDVGEVWLGIGQLNVPIHASNLHFQDFVLGFFHDMRVAGAGHQVRRAVGDHEVFGRNEHRAGSFEDRVVVNLLEGRASKRKLEQHLLHLVAVLCHFLGDEVVHLRLYTISLIHFLRRHLAHNFGTDRARSRIQFAHGLRLETNNGFGQHGVEHARCTRPRLAALFDLHAKQIKALDVSSRPLAARLAVRFKITHKFGCHRLQV